MKWDDLIRQADADDANYVRSTWASSYRNSPWRGTYRDSEHDRICTDTIIHLYKRGAKVAVVANPTNKRIMLGWICYETFDDQTVLHYMFVKPIYRRQGVAQSLTKHAGIDLGAEFSYSHKTPVCGKIFKNGKYRPEIARRAEVGRKRDKATDSRTMAEATSAGPEE